jgi:signal transduction histidine kinase
VREHRIFAAFAPQVCCANQPTLRFSLHHICLCICSFRQVLFNLLSNACKFTPSKGSVSVRIYNDEEHPEEVVASVSDTGIGIKQENLKLLFAVRY